MRERSCATSIDLCVAELTRSSRHAAGTTIFADAGEDALFAERIIRFAPDEPSRERLAVVTRFARETRPDAVVVQQHLPTAAALVHALPDLRVFLHAHNFTKRPRYSNIPLVGGIARSVARHGFRRIA